MSGEVFYRDPRAPRDVQGPFPVDRLREFARDGRLRVYDEVSHDAQSWMPATSFDPTLFPEASAAGAGPQAQWQRWAQFTGRMIRAGALAVWEHLKRVARFYWSNLGELRILLTEYVTFLQDPGDRRELRISADDHNDHIYLYGDRWTAELPDCCVVCGEDADCEWNSEHRSVPNLIWPLWAPIFGLIFGCMGWVFMWDAEGRWLIPLGLLIGFLVGYQARGETVVAIRFRRCRQHLNQTHLPSLRTFRKTLIIGVGDRKVWRRFHYGDRGMETPTVPPDFLKEAQSPISATSEGDGKPSYPTIPLVGDDEMGSNPH
jgi:hypothetical protein